MGTRTRRRTLRDGSEAEKSPVVARKTRRLDVQQVAPDLDGKGARLHPRAALARVEAKVVVVPRADEHLVVFHICAATTPLSRVPPAATLGVPHLQSRRLRAQGGSAAARKEDWRTYARAEQRGAGTRTPSPSMMAARRRPAVTGSGTAGSSRAGWDRGVSATKGRAGDLTRRTPRGQRKQVSRPWSAGVELLKSGRPRKKQGSTAADGVHTSFPCKRIALDNGRSHRRCWTTMQIKLRRPSSGTPSQPPPPGTKDYLLLT
mgnify:CR=1 FL=1